MTKDTINHRLRIAFASVSAAALLAACEDFSSPTNPPIAQPPPPPAAYEVWGADQSNSVAGETSRGVNGSYIWIWNSENIEAQIAGGAAAAPIGCDAAGTAAGPCDVHDVFPGTLTEVDTSGAATGNTLASLPAFGRLHGMLPDPQNLYMNINMFAPGGGYVGIVDGRTKEAVALFRVSETSAGRSLHMSFWNEDGSAILLANLHGRILERIDITRDANDNITGADFNLSASLGVGKGMSVTSEATAFTGNNAHGNALVSSVSGAYDTAALGDLTPNGMCKENGCTSGPDGSQGGRPTNVIVCPIVSDNNNVYITFGGGGLLVADSTATPMTVVGEYSQAVVNGAGCGGVQIDNEMWLNAGVSASGAGFDQSTYSMYTIDDVFAGTPQGENMPLPTEVFKDPSNTSTLGNASGAATNTTGQVPGTTTRRDAHGAIATINGSHVHNVDRIQNNVEVFDSVSYSRTTYDLTSADGQGSGTGPCEAASVTDDANLPSNDPAPDLMGAGPNGNYLFVALRGPIPVSVTHSAQGSCPGVGVIEVQNNGASGRLVAVLRSTNTIDTADVSAPGGIAYAGSEHSDIHGASVRVRVEDN